MCCPQCPLCVVPSAPCVCCPQPSPVCCPQCPPVCAVPQCSRVLAPSPPTPVMLTLLTSTPQSHVQEAMTPSTVLLVSVLNKDRQKLLSGGSILAYGFVGTPPHHGGKGMVVFTTGTGKATASCSSWRKQRAQARASSCKPPRAFCSDFCQTGSMSQNSTGRCRARGKSYAPLKGISALGEREPGTTLQEGRNSHHVRGKRWDCGD